MLIPGRAALLLVPLIFAYACLGSRPAAAFDTWIELRDRGVVRQERDFSCGLAALATLLAQEGEAQVSEETLLSDLLRQRGYGARAVIEDRGVSFADLATLARRYGRRSLGVALPSRALKSLRRPAIVALEVHGRAHFSVLRGVAEDGSALLADPSWGNRRLGAWQLEKLFAPGGGAGRVLLIEGPAGAPGSGLGRRPEPTGVRPHAPLIRKPPVRIFPRLWGSTAPG